MSGHTLYTPPARAVRRAFSVSGPEEVTPAGWKSLAIGTVIAAVVFALPFARFVFGYLDVLVHELGHTVAAWGFGYPAIPAFDWRYGGGVTVNSERSTLVLLLVYAAFGYLLYHLRHEPWPRNVLLLVVAVYSLAAFTPVHEVIQLAMGHLMELLIAGVFFYRALAGRSLTHAVERPLYAACAVFMLLQNTALAWGLMGSAEAREVYGAAKGGGHWMDLSRLGRDYLGVSLPTVAFLLLAACLLAPCMSFLIYRYQTPLKEGLERWLTGES